MDLRTATVADTDAIRILIAASVRGLQYEYSEGQREAALASVFTPDTQLIADGTYFVIEAPEGALAACGGWSQRRTLYGGDHHHATRDGAALDPARDAAKIRAFFVHPEWARQGLGTRLLAACERAAWEAGFRRAEMGATLSGVPLYGRHGYRRVEISSYEAGQWSVDRFAISRLLLWRGRRFCFAAIDRARFKWLSLP